MKHLLIILFLTTLFSSCANSQKQPTPHLVGGPCEGCEAVFEFGNKILEPVDTLPGFYEDGIRIKITGTIFQEDGRSPANDVILYVYHTNQKGIYPTKGDETGWAKRHGYLRGWIKTSSNGQYEFYTLKPAVYPDRTEPAHIHATILEPDGKYYWIEDYYFEGDNLLKQKHINPTSPRGGSTGVLTLKKEGDIWVGKRDIILGKNIPAYK
ncbi:hypothetical protein [Aridibaculum aurantiacum]|uniref:dioxygenase family protein n=1 Tax=Aridibaculum aurantiacum TaxID=2810307 RepID=UPI001A963760|nr:hypothetical protein [Aridibaculum aurantiacum]